ncbi:MAG TPA: extracellular solute-binding protein, partial [Chloroflexota bacterium]
APAGKPVEIRAHMVKKIDVSDWIQTGLDQNIGGWKTQYPNVTVTLETVPGWTDAYYPKIFALASADELGDAVWYPPRHGDDFAWATQFNLVRPLDALAATAKYDRSQFFPAGIAGNSINGKWYWFPYIAEPVVPVIAYNKTKAQLLGLQEPTDDMTFEDWSAWAKSGTRSGTSPTYGFYHGDWGNDPFGNGPLLRQFGVEPVSADGTKATFLSSGGNGFSDALQWRSDLVNTVKAEPPPNLPGGINQDKLFQGQQLLAAPVWPFRIQNYPTMFKDFEMGFVLTPTVKKGDKRRSMLNQHVFGVTMASKNPGVAFDFLAWICGKDMELEGLLQGPKGPSVRVDFWQDPRIYQKYPTYAKLKPIMENIEPDYLVANYRGGDFDSAFSKEVGLLLSGKTGVDTAATQIQQLCQAVLSQSAPGVPAQPKK